MCHDIVLINLNQYKIAWKCIKLREGNGKRRGNNHLPEDCIAQFWIMLHCCTGNADWYLKFDVNSDKNLRYNHNKKHTPLGSLHIWKPIIKRLHKKCIKPWQYVQSPWLIFSKCLLLVRTTCGILTFRSFPKVNFIVTI